MKTFKVKKTGVRRGVEHSSELDKGTNVKTQYKFDLYLPIIEKVFHLMCIVGVMLCLLISLKSCNTFYYVDTALSDHVYSSKADMSVMNYMSNKGMDSIMCSVLFDESDIKHQHPVLQCIGSVDFDSGSAVMARSDTPAVWNPTKKDFDNMLNNNWFNLNLEKDSKHSVSNSIGATYERMFYKGNKIAYEQVIPLMDNILHQYGIFFKKQSQTDMHMLTIVD